MGTPDPQGTGQAEIAELRRSYLAEIDRLRQLVIASADSLDVIEETLVPLCQHSTEENAEVRSALLELRIVNANLKASGRPHGVAKRDPEAKVVGLMAALERSVKEAKPNKESSMATNTLQHSAEWLLREWDANGRDSEFLPSCIEQLRESVAHADGA